MSTPPITGGCHCGRVTFTYAGPVNMQYICHCSDCRRINGTAWHAGLLIDSAQFEYNGEVAEYTVTADSGRPLTRSFCPVCGSQLWSTTSRGAEFLSLKAGVLDDQSTFSPGTEIWADSKAPWAFPTDIEQSYSQGTNSGAAKGHAS